MAGIYILIGLHLITLVLVCLVLHRLIRTNQGARRAVKTLMSVPRSQAGCLFINASGEERDGSVHVRPVAGLPEGVPPRFARPPGSGPGVFYRLQGRDDRNRWVYREGVR